MNEPQATAATEKKNDTLIILGARMDVLTDPDLTEGAKVLFCLLLDLSLDPGVNNNFRGEILISTTQIGERIKCSDRAIYGWKKELLAKRFVWITSVPRPNMHPMHKFHITALQPRKEVRQEVAGDGLWGNGYRRPEAVMPLGARGRANLHKRAVRGLALVDRFGSPISSDLLKDAAPTRTERQFQPANFAGASGRFCHSNPQDLRVEDAQNDTASPQYVRVPPAELAGTVGTKHQSYGESQKEIERVQVGGKGKLPPTADAFDVWCRSIAGTPAYPTHQSKLEKLKAGLALEMNNARTPQGRAMAQRKLQFVKQLLNPTAPEEIEARKSPVRAATSKGVKLPTPPRMSSEQLKKNWLAAQPKLSPETVTAGV